MKRSNFSHLQRAHHSEQQSRLFFCQGCCCTLLKFDLNLIKARQPLQCFSLVWNNPKQCHVASSLSKILCRACHLLWDLCGDHAEKFKAACDVYFRGHGRVMNHPQSAYYNNIMDIPTIRCVNYNDMADRLPLGAIKAAWLMQLGGGATDSGSGQGARHAVDRGHVTSGFKQGRSTWMVMMRNPVASQDDLGPQQEQRGNILNDDDEQPRGAKATRKRGGRRRPWRVGQLCETRRKQNRWRLHATALFVGSRTATGACRVGGLLLQASRQILVRIPINWSKDGEYFNALALTSRRKPIAKNNFIWHTVFSATRGKSMRSRQRDRLAQARVVYHSHGHEGKGLGEAKFMEIRFLRPVIPPKQPPNLAQRQTIRGSSIRSRSATLQRSAAITKIQIKRAKRRKSISIS